MRGAEQLSAALRDLLGRRRSALLGGLAVALTLAPLDLGRQLLVRDDPSRLNALLVDVVGVLTAALAQVLLVGALAGEQRWLPGGWRLVLAAVRRRPAALLAGLLLAGGVSAVLTLPVSVAALGLSQVVGPLDGPPLGSLLVAGASDLVATAVTAPYFALLVGRLAR